MVARNIIYIFIALGFSSELAISQKKDSNEVLFSVEQSPVSVEEFKYVYSKNNINNDSAYTQSDIQEYFDLFVNFKLKIQEAESRNMDDSEAFQKELNGYIEQLKKPYMTENEVTERLVKQAYNRFKQEVRAQHILLKTDGEDTLVAYNKAIDLRNKILKGESFTKIAREYSDDPSVKVNNGDLGYFTSFQMVYPFESAAYKTSVGNVSMPVKTQFGYHLVKVIDKRSSNGKVQVAHIMLRHKPDSIAVRNKIFEIHEQAIGGVDWNELVKQNSDDINSKNTNGVLRPFSVGQMPLPFQEMAFSLIEPNQISDPIKTKYGWHIIKLVKKEEIQPFEEMKEMISARVSKDVRSEQNEKALIRRLKKENGFSLNDQSYGLLKEKLDSSILKGKWNPQLGKKLNKDLFTVGDKDFTINNFLIYLNSIDKTSSYSPNYYFDLQLKEFQMNEIKNYEEDHLEEKYIDYRMLVKEYREGIMLFQLMEEEVWNKAVEDSVGLLAFYNKHQRDYMWAKRAKMKMYSSKDENIINRIKKAIEETDSIFLSKENLYKTFNSGSSVTLQTESGIFERGVIEVLDQVTWQEGVYITKYAGKDHLVWIQDIEKPRVKKLDEAKGEIISDYQNLLEKEWLEELKDKYTVSVNQEALSKVYEELVK